MFNKVRVRLAPSPTGFLHIGTARTALFNFLFAKKSNGAFVLRIEDTDSERSDPKFEEDIKEGLQWLGLEWDEFYRQSERLEIYKKCLGKLLDEGKAFWCFHTKDQLEAEQNEQMVKKEAPRHVCSYKTHESRLMNQEKGIIRLKVDENSTRVIHFNDLIRGVIEWEQRLIGDFSIAKNENKPLYNFAVVVDDEDMRISHIIRGEDHISNTPKQILLQEALGFSSPEFAHLPLILGSDRSKLSKRHGALSLIEYRNMGYLPEAVANYLTLLGWTPKEIQKLNSKDQNGKRGNQTEEIYNLDQMIQRFDIREVHKSGAVFDIKKLNWMNNFYIRQLPPEQFENAVVPFILKEIRPEKVEDDFVEKIRPILIERLQRLSDIKEFDYLFQVPDYEQGLLKWKDMSDGEVRRSLGLVKEALSSNIEWELFDKDYIKKELDDLAIREFKGDRGAVYWPLRVALSGKEKSPDPIAIMSVLTRAEFLIRIDEAIGK